MTEKNATKLHFLSFKKRGTFKRKLIGVQLIYNVMLVSAVQKSESVIYICPFLFRFFSHIDHYRALSRVPCTIQ